MNNQEIFDTVARHLIKQGKPAKSPDGACRYRTALGLMCAVGCLIPDDKYAAVIEGQSVGYAFDNAPQMFPGIKPENIAILNELQNMHDHYWSDDAGIRDLLRGVAKKFGLSAAAVTP